MSNSVRPHRWQPTRFPRPWDCPGKNTKVGCHFCLQCMKVKSESEVAQSYLTLSNPMDCSLPGSSIHGIFQTRVLEWSAIVFFASLPAPQKKKKKKTRNLTKDLKDLQAKNYKTMIKETEWTQVKRYPMFKGENTIKISILTKATYTFMQSLPTFQ